jgi:hypothetical protein
MWLERFVIIVTSLHRDFLPSSWAMYSPTIFDWSMFIGTIGFFFTLIYLFVRFLPIISIFEVRTLLPDAQVNTVTERTMICTTNLRILLKASTKRRAENAADWKRLMMKEGRRIL